MELRAFLNDDGTFAVSFGRDPANMTSLEGVFHSVTFTINDADGKPDRAITVVPGDKPEVTGPEPAPVQHEAEATGHAAEPGQAKVAEGFAAAGTGEVKP